MRLQNWQHRYLRSSAPAQFFLEMAVRFSGLIAQLAAQLAAQLSAL
jgi:hypothetical protein